MENVLEVNDLKKSYPDFALDMTFTMKMGFIMGFIGPNGAGKTTTIKLIMNLLQRDAGTVRLFGMDNLENEIAVKERIGFVYDDNHFYEELTPMELQAILAPFYKRWDKQVFNTYLKRFDLPRGKKIQQFSKGMKAKFALAVALSHHAELIILDEPTSGLDPVFRRELLDIFAEMIEDGTRSILFSTHITSDLDRTADYITFINNGKLIFSLEKDAVFETYALVKGSSELLDTEMKKQFVGLRNSPYGFEGLTADADAARRMFDGRALIEKASLEEIMLYTVKGEA
ncbi:ABC transporter ATP-binding protein [Dethiobacter alkaliphilus]|uniref:ABC transporter related protein n=1 Tax=Dethiobacter alkaliphilus AHT 1 TaxID=555088 RepID=C0GC77_DETAL|nr:ABC transporter ATP-binding protein [Dethiobacter alkaliphilus]EEG78812.1 ABC transporter related protein [Dethiobacter alkaliphilus AHT 1]